jgi:8-oxo-dGTP diphosphatase
MTNDQIAESRSNSRELQGDTEFLAGYDPSLFEHPSVAVDVVVVTEDGGSLKVVLVQRTEAPQKGHWALPGGFVGIGESLDNAAARVLREKAGLEDVYVEQLYTFGEVERDPRTRVITVAYLALVDFATLEGSLGEEVELASVHVPWKGEEGGAVTVESAAGEELALAFDHDEVLGAAVKRLRGKLDYAPVGYEFLPAEFALRDLQEIHEAVLGRDLNKDSFRRKILARGQVSATGRSEKGAKWRPAELYRFVGVGKGAKRPKIGTARVR